MWVCGSRVCVICAPGPERPEIAVISGVSDAKFPGVISSTAKTIQPDENNNLPIAMKNEKGDSI